MEAELKGNNYALLVSVGGAPWQTLPVPGGAMSVFPTDVSDRRFVAATARNSVTGQWGCVLLTRTGTLPPPTAPANLQGVPSTATHMEPCNSISLTWQNISTLTQSYELQRREAAGITWTLLSLTPPGTATNYTDTTGGAGITCKYRMRSVGLSGASPWSSTVTSPAMPLDTTPANGVAVSGTVTDHVAVEYLEISYWDQYLGQQVALGSVSNAGAFTVNWETRSLTPAA